MVHDVLRDVGGTLLAASKVLLPKHSTKVREHVTPMVPTACLTALLPALLPTVHSEESENVKKWRIVRWPINQSINQCHNGSSSTVKQSKTCASRGRATCAQPVSYGTCDVRDKKCDFSDEAMRPELRTAPLQYRKVDVFTMPATHCLIPAQVSCRGLPLINTKWGHHNCQEPSKAPIAILTHNIVPWTTSSCI